MLNNEMRCSMTMNKKILKKNELIFMTSCSRLTTKLDSIAVVLEKSKLAVPSRLMLVIGAMLKTSRKWHLQIQICNSSTRKPAIPWQLQNSKVPDCCHIGASLPEVITFKKKLCLNERTYNFKIIINRYLSTTRSICMLDCISNFSFLPR